MNWSAGDVLESLDVEHMFLEYGDIVYEGGGFCPQYDPSEPDPKFRYFAGVGCGHSGLCMVRSHDGIHWEAAGVKFYSNHTAVDTYTCIYRDGGNYTAFMRHIYSTDSTPGYSNGW